MELTPFFRRALVLALVAVPPVVVLACGAAEQPAPAAPPIALPAPPDGATEAREASSDARVAAEPTHPPTCARDYAAHAKAPNAAELERWRQLAEAPDASARDRSMAELARASLYFKAERLDDALAVLEPLVWNGAPDVAMQAMELYLAGMNQAGPLCRTEMEDSVPKLRQRLCAGSHDDRCERLELIDFELRMGHGLMLSETEPSQAAAAFDRLFQDMCRPAKPKMECAMVAYDAALLWVRIGDPAKAKAMLAAMKDKRNGIDQSPLVKKLECVLSAQGGKGDAGSC